MKEVLLFCVLMKCHGDCVVSSRPHLFQSTRGTWKACTLTSYAVFTHRLRPYRGYSCTPAANTADASHPAPVCWSVRHGSYRGIPILRSARPCLHLGSAPPSTTTAGVGHFAARAFAQPSPFRTGTALCDCCCCCLVSGVVVACPCLCSVVTTPPPPCPPRLLTHASLLLPFVC